VAHHPLRFLSVSSLALSLFSCKRLGENPEDFYLMQDLSQRCYDDTHIFWILYVGIPLLALFVVGVPLGAWLTLLYHSDAIKSTCFCAFGCFLLYARC